MDVEVGHASREACVDSVRVLHQTITTLKAALEDSRSEILELKSKTLPRDATEQALQSLSIENHVLRQKIVRSELNKQNPDEHTLQERGEYRTVDITSENIIGKGAKLKKSSQLSRSKIISFSNTKDSDRQISTSNSLRIPIVKFQEAPIIKKSSYKLGKSEVTQQELPNKIVESNLEFQEEVLSNNVIVSRKGSISNFVTRGDEAVGKSEKSQQKSIKKSENAQGHYKNRNRIKIDKTNTEELTECDNTQNKCDLSKVIRKDSVTNNKNTSVDSNNKETTHKVNNKKCKNNKLAKLSNKPDANTQDVNPMVSIENVAISGKSEREGDKIINSQSANINLEEKKSTEISDGPAVALGKTQIEENHSQNQDISKSKETEAEQNNKDSVDIRNICTKELTETNQTVKNNEQFINKENILKSTTENINSDNTENSSETSSSSVLKQKNIEVSVKICKKLKKPIEINIKTKRKHSLGKSKKSKMNSKSQNVSFDKEYSESDQLTTNEVRRQISNVTTGNNVTSILQNDIEQEVDDIELIFTTDDTKDTDFKEELIPIETYADAQLLPCPSDYEGKLSAEASDRDLEDDVFNDNFENENQENSAFQSQTYDFRRENSQIYNSKSDNSINHEDKSLKSYYSYQDSSFENKSFEKDESFDRFEEKTTIIETDISKIGIQDVEYNMGRRNTCPNPIQYRPIIHREALGRGLNSRKCRPILAHPNVARKESGAQTDISALPGSAWRSESSLGHKVKVGENFPTLPSKFPHPGSRLRLSEKTVEARRVLLSDIGFTSMVPELSRSADHLFPQVVRGPVVTSYGQFLRTTDLYSPAYTSQKFVWTNTTPSEGSHSQSRYSSQYPLSPPAPTRRCSAPVSPSKKVLKPAQSKVRFANGSLPELRGDWMTTDSGESTDSLVEEAEHFLRRSIDCLAPCKEICFRSESMKISSARRASAPEPTRDNVPPQGWQPFLPRIPRDLHLDYWVKVISPEGRVRGGRVRYVGPLMNQTEAFVGVQLSTPDGHSDGTYNNRRYFNCEPYHGLFVPFKKIIMGWRP